jgi:hypothetical protein
MKLQRAALFLLLALMMVGESMAQTIRMKANVPFDFIVNGSSLPAGEYTIQSFGAIDGKTLRLGNVGSRQGALVNTVGMDAAKASGQTKLIFHRYGDRYFLAQVWIAGSDHGQALPVSHRESELARDYQNHFQEVDLIAAIR